MAGVAAFAARVGAARPAEADLVFFGAAGSVLVADVVLAERAALVSVTFVDGSVEPVTVAFFSPVVFAIAIPSLQEAG